MPGLACPDTVGCMLAQPQPSGALHCLIATQDTGELDGHFGNDAANPLFSREGATEAGAALLVDETSMLDLPLAAALLDALPATSACSSSSWVRRSCLLD